MIEVVNTHDDQPIKQSETNRIPDSHEDVTQKSVTINVFFDGTGNNMFNTDIRNKTSPSEKEVKLQNKLAEEISYLNDYSNVAHLYKSCTTNSTMDSVYIEGAGTIKEKKDATWGLAGAWFESGINNRVKDGFNQANTKAMVMKAKGIVFNVFGFSRGAFYGRYFCALAKMTPPKNNAFVRGIKAVTNFITVDRFDEYTRAGRDQLLFDGDDVSINFVGIYDTVTSEGFSPNNDAIPFRQNIGSDQKINKIFHLTAQDEFRNHFPLAKINSSVKQKNADNHYIGFECSLPGAHADIGGGYIKPWQETDKYLSLFDVPKKESDLGNESEIHWTWFMDKGFYDNKGKTLEKKEGQYGDFTVKENFELIGENLFEVYATRKMPGNEYQFIGLKLMHEVAKQEGKLSFDNKLGKMDLDGCISSMEKISKLNDFYEYVWGLIKDKVTLGGTLDVNMENCKKLTKKDCQTIYHDYIHNTLVAKMIWNMKEKTAYIVNGSDRNNKDGNFKPRRIITLDNQGYMQNRKATDSVSVS